eukprot:m.81899 g.81899  ORF g.81899 m.81899 type:complete len:366 (-) comp9429_c0_seq2:135-1232(-)
MRAKRTDPRNAPSRMIALALSCVLAASLVWVLTCAGSPEQRSASECTDTGTGCVEHALVRASHTSVSVRPQSQGQMRSQRDGELDMSQPHRTNATTVLLVRGHGLSRAMLDRITDWAVAGARVRPRIDVALSLDTTTRRGQHDIASKHFQQRGVSSLVSIHLYDTNDMYVEFPTLQDAVNKSIYPSVTSAAYGFHTEAIALWYKALPLAKQERYKYIWVFESDVAFSGTGFGLMAKLAGYGPADLVSHGCSSVSADWGHTDVVSPAYNASVPRSMRRRCVEAVQRFSQAFLKDMLKRMDRGEHAWSEQATCSWAAVGGFRVQSMKKTDIGVPFSISSSNKVTKFLFSRFAHHSFRQDKLYHPVKF